MFISRVVLHRQLQSCMYVSGHASWHGKEIHGVFSIGGTYVLPQTYSPTSD